MTELSSAEQRVLDALDETALVQELIDLIRVPSVTGTDAESDLQHRFRGQLDELGFEVDAWKLDLEALRAHPDFPGTEAPRVEGYGVVGQLGPSGRPALVLQAHVDVVPTGDLDKWFDRDPFSGLIRGGVVHGRGACDMKAGAAVNLAVARALVASGLRLERPFALHSVVSEEDGGQPCLDLVAGRVKLFGGDLPVPHMGWNEVQQTSADHPLYDGIPDGAAFYFAHSYYCVPEHEDAALATTDYGLNFASSLGAGNVMGVQFHPEKSGRWGLRLLQNFVAITAAGGVEQKRTALVEAGK